MNKRVQHWSLSFLCLLVIGTACLGYVTDTPDTLSSDVGTTFQNGYVGDAAAQYEIGMFYLQSAESESEYLESTQEKARKWISLAANQGNADAQLQLGLMYAAGTGGEQDHALAVSWIGKAAEQNHPRALDMLHWMSQSAH
ncbi:tetratricopeptide repeat protein [Vibrio barjaei]|jgi:TPR repeat protein|uniref:Tetratricopeptide repeat protein n=1 Tax=Vibrio barjaei TaxID=1676683 RepID=A0ABW7IJ29_9VIBR